MSFWRAVDLVARSVDLISRRISSTDLEMKAVVSAPGRWRRRPLIRSSRVRWNRETINEGPDIFVPNQKQSIALSVPMRSS